ncbi:MAG: hypothetical protein IT374_02605 [Polyangiaceae bacterium]|nr:hypothetical protein [Polyangiaceae bacterium]
MSDDRVDHRGGARPAHSMTFDEARTLPALRERNTMTLRRALDPVRTGRWLPEGERHWRLLYDGAKVRAIARALQIGEANPYRPPQYGSGRRTERVPSPMPHGVPEGWATVEQIWQAMRRAGYDMTRMTNRQLRAALLEHGVPSERRVPTQRIERVFRFAEVKRVYDRLS